MPASFARELQKPVLDRFSTRAGAITMNRLLRCTIDGRRPSAFHSWWQSRAGTDTFSSYDFSLVEAIPAASDDGADTYFGLCKGTGGRKS